MFSAVEMSVDGAVMSALTSWRDAASRRCRALLPFVSSGSDRLALVRTLAWLEGGRLDLAVENIYLDADEAALLDRFGLRASGDGTAVRLTDGAAPDWWPSSLNVDPTDRRGLAPASADAILRRVTPNPLYRSHAQKAAVRALLTQPPGSGLIISMPTGAGKSLLFQLAALQGRMERRGACVVVVTPTIALALDHERSLSTMPGLEASRALTGDQPPKRAREIVDAFRRGEVPVLFLGPEAALRDGVVEHLVEAARPDAAEFGLEAKLTHLFVDEAHIVESWGRSFRPDFQRLPGLLARLREADPDIRLVLLSATLSPGARTVLREGWALDGTWLEIDARVPRYEHDVIVSSFASPQLRQNALGWVIDRVPRPAIIYTTEVDRAHEVHQWLVRERGYARAALFTGDTPTAERRRVIEGWARDEIDLVVATSAFGMGVDKADVRSVVHACLPEGPARWYQEVGRAARDGGQGIAVLLFNSAGTRDDDVYRARSLATGGWLTRDLAEKRWVAMLDAAKGKSWVDGRFRLTVDLDAVREGLRPQSSDYNRGWNMALLTLLQRAGTLDILSVGGCDEIAGHVWEVEVLDNALLGTPDVAWDCIFRIRQAELDGARADLLPFVHLMERPTRACVTRAVFELIEPLSFAPPCGRCPHCRIESLTAPQGLLCGGLEAAWAEPLPYCGPLPSGPLLVEPRDLSISDNLAPLLQSLGGAGIEQFIVPSGLAPRVASMLAETLCRLGLVLTFDEWSTESVLAAAPTALLLPQGEAVKDLVTRLAAWAHGRPFPVVLVAGCDRLVRGRRLDQCFSRYAPISQDRLPVGEQITEELR